MGCAVEQLLRNSQSGLFAFLLGRLGHREDALDALQDVLMATWDKREALDGLPLDQQRRYLYAAARNRSIDVVRSRARAQRSSRSFCDADEPVAAGPESKPLDELEQLGRLIGQLDPDSCVLIHLSYVGGLSCKEIADCLGRPAGTVRSQLTRLRQRLRRQMEGHNQ